MSTYLFITKGLFSVTNLMFLVGPILSGVSTFFVLSDLMVPARITIASTLSISLVVFGICMHYRHIRITGTGIIRVYEESLGNVKLRSNLPFIIVYILLLVICTSNTYEGTEQFIPWKEFDAIDVIRVAAAISVSFFLPGYALIAIIDKRNQLQLLPRFLIAFLFSMLITGLITYALGSAGFASPHIKYTLTSMWGLILVLYALANLRFIIKRSVLIRLESFQKFWILVRNYLSEIITFSGFLALVLLSTTYLYGGVIISDHWFHYSRANYFVDGSFRDIASQDADWLYPPFFSAVLGGFFSSSGVPPVNAYVAIHVLNLMPILAFYYFFTRWSPAGLKRAALIAAGLFVLSSGFGWIYVITSSLAEPTLLPVDSAYHLQEGGVKTFDVHLPNTFMNVSAPDFTTGLIIIGLPAGFVLLGLLKEKIGDRIRYIAIVLAVSFIGILSHDEFYLFIIVASIIPPLFRQEGKNYFYAAILAALALTALVDLTSPAKYYTVRGIFGIPLAVLSFLFIVIMWVMYASQILQKLGARIGRSSLMLRIIASNNIRLPIIIFVVSLVAYLYFFTFIVWTEFSLYEITTHTSNDGQRVIPWYLYPMKFGITGALGLALLLSYLFKRFEKEIFVFGIIAVVALLAGPYYDQHRFGKYIMVGMVGFASILVYKLILLIQRNDASDHSALWRPLACSILLGLVFTSASLSVFMFIGYRALLIEYPIVNPPGKLDFPTPSEMQLISFLENKGTGSEVPNIASWTKEYNLHYGFIGKLEPFLGVSRSKLLQSPLTLNASSLEGIYKLLEYSDTGAIVLPRYGLSGNGSLKYEAFVPSHNEEDNHQRDMSNPLNFVFDNFPKSYPVENYTVLNVPPLSAPSSERSAQIGLAFEPNVLSSGAKFVNYANSTSTLPYRDDVYTGLNDNKKFMKVQGDGIGDEILTMDADKRGRTLWSGSLDQKNVDINYIETKLRFIDFNKTNNDFGIKFQDKNSDYEYFAPIVNHLSALELRQTPIVQDDKSSDNKDSKELVLSQNQELTLKKNTWHTLKILILKDTINVYLDDIIKLMVSKYPYAGNLTSISKVGVEANNNTAQFGPIKIGHVSDSYVKAYDESTMQREYYHHYYPLSALALAKLGYDTFMDGDLSILSKKLIILTSDPILETNETRGKQGNQRENFVTEDEFDRYLNFARLGGTLIVMNPDEDKHNIKPEQTAFSKFLSIRYLNESKFNAIASSNIIGNLTSKVQDYSEEQVFREVMQKGKKNEEGRITQEERQLLNISGVAKNIQLGNSSDTSVISFYLNLGNGTDEYKQEVSPFAIEKKFGKGRIIMVNAKGYFDTLFRFPDKSFQSLGLIPNLIGLENDFSNNDELPVKKEIPVRRFIGNFDAAGQVLVNSSSFMLADKYFDPGHGLKGDIFFSGDKNGDGKKEDVELKFEDALIKDLRLIGQYDVSISSNGIFHMPSRPSEYDYVVFAALLPIDVSIKLYNGSGAEISVGNSTNYFESNGDSEIHLRDVRMGDEGFVEVLMKSPQIKVKDGKSKFSRLYTDDPMVVQLDKERGFGEGRPDFSGAETEVTGNLSFRFDHVDHYNSGYKNGTTLMYISYLKSLGLDGGSVVDQKTVSFKMPGDLSPLAREMGMYVPLKRTLVSDANILLLIFIPIAVIIVVKFGPGIRSIRRKRI
jgi:hypothetical protein